MSDERHGLPSASSAHRYALCPGSFLLEQSIQRPDVTGPDAQVGNRIHGDLAGEGIALNEEEAKLAIDCRLQEVELAKAVFPFQDRLQAMREKRLWEYES